MSYLCNPLTVSSLTQKMERLAVSEVSASNTTVSLVGTMLSALEKSEMTTLGSLRTQLCGVLFVYKIARQALECIEKRNLHEISDALVSDCACQTRALMVACMIRRLMKDTTMQKELSLLQTKLTDVIGEIQRKTNSLSNPKKAQEKIKPIMLEGYLKQEKLDIEVSSEVAVLAQCYLLNKAKRLGKQPTTCSECAQEVFTVHEETDASRLESIQKGLGEKAKAAIVASTKVALAAASCEFIHKQAAQIHADSMDEMSLQLLAKENQVTVKGRQEIPCYASCMTVFQTARQEQIPVLLKVRKAAHSVEQLNEPYDVHLLLKAPTAGASFIAVQPSQEDLRAPVIIVEGQRSGKAIEKETTEEYVKRFMKQNFMKLIRLNAAAHKPYSDGKVQVPSIGKISQEALEDYAELQKKAEEMGCCLKNQTLLAITHIYCDTLANQKVQGKISGGKNG